MFTLLTQPQSVFRVIGNAFGLFKESLLKVLPITLIWAVIMIINVFISKPLAIDYVLMIIVMLIAFYIVPLLFCRIISIMNNAKENWSIILLFALKKCWICFLALLVFIAIMCVFISPVFLPMVVRSFVAPAALTQMGNMIKIIFMVSFVVSFIFGCYAVILFGLFIPAILVDNKGIFSSIGYSARLVWGNWWRTFFVMLVVGIIGVAFVVVFVLGFIWIVKIAHLPKLSLMIGLPIIMYGLKSIFVMPFTISSHLCIYNNLKLRLQKVSSV